MTMFNGAEVISDTGILDVEILEKYIKEHLGGVIPERYANVERHISFTDGEINDSHSSNGNLAIWIAAAAVLAFAAAYAIAMGSVQPMAGVSSFLRISA